MQCGGTEVWHQTLLPRLGDDVSGFVAFDPGMATGDFSLLDCTTGVGLEAARNLAEACDVLVVWGLGRNLGKVMNGLVNRPKVISIAHCDTGSEWTIEFMHAQSRWSDWMVHLTPPGVETIPKGFRKRSTLIPNAPNPLRIASRRGRKQTRKEHGIADGDICLLVTSRISPEKHIEKLVQAMDHLPPWYKLIVAGGATDWALDYFDQMKANANERVKFVGFVTHPGDLLSACDGVLSAAKYEGFGLAMAEGLLAGKPLIATQTGFLVGNPGLAAIVAIDATPRDWAAAIEKEFANSGPQRARAVAAKRFIEREHSVDNFVNAWRNIVRSVTA